MHPLQLSISELKTGLLGSKPRILWGVIGLQDQDLSPQAYGRPGRSRPEAVAEGIKGHVLASCEAPALGTDEATAPCVVRA
jgi:hypothetical protein